MALTKIINDENKSYRPVLTDKLVLDAKPTVNSFNSITSDAVARAIAGASGEVPQVTESDDGKVLTAVYDEGGAAVEWAEAQGASYTAGDGIVIDQNNEISVDYDTNTLDIVGQTITANVTQQSASGLFLLPSSIAALLSQQTNTQVTVHIPANMLRDEGHFDYSDDPDLTFWFTLYATDSTSETDVSLFSTPVLWENAFEYGLIEEQDIVINLPASVANQWSQSLSSAVAFSICPQRNGSTTRTDWPVELFGNLSTNPITCSYVDASVTKLAVKNPIPSFNTTTDAGKVLTVNSGATGVEWASTQLPEEKSLASANNTISITEGATTVSIDVTNPIPAYDTTTDLGKVLQVTANGLAWVSLT